MKLEDDNILADILGELDNTKTNGLSTSQTNTSLKSIQEEKTMINEYMASFSKNVFKKRELRRETDPSDDVRFQFIVGSFHCSIYALRFSGNSGENSQTHQTH